MRDSPYYIISASQEKKNTDVKDWREVRAMILKTFIYYNLFSA